MVDCIKSRLHPEYLSCDRPAEEGVAVEDYQSLDFVSGGSHIYGLILKPAHREGELHPCAMVIHGFPGSCRNDDLAQALRRAGCVVIVPHHRGAWGSEGKYLFSHCVEDVVNLTNWARSDKFCEEMHVDKDNIFLIGHSIGGNTVLNATRVLKENVKATVMITPFDVTRYYTKHGYDATDKLLFSDGYVLKSDGKQAWVDDINSHPDYEFAKAADDMAGKPLLLIGGEKDWISPIEEMVDPLWNALECIESSAIHRKEILNCGHGLDNLRHKLAEVIVEFLQEVITE